MLRNASARLRDSSISSVTKKSIVPTTTPSTSNGRHTPRPPRHRRPHAVGHLTEIPHEHHLPGLPRPPGQPTPSGKLASRRNPSPASRAATLAGATSPSSRASAAPRQTWIVGAKIACIRSAAHE